MQFKSGLQFFKNPACLWPMPLLPYQPRLYKFYVLSYRDGIWSAHITNYLRRYILVSFVGRLTNGPLSFPGARLQNLTMWLSSLQFQHLIITSLFIVLIPTLTIIMIIIRCSRAHGFYRYPSTTVANLHRLVFIFRACIKSSFPFQLK